MLSPHTMGISKLLYQSNLILYDRATTTHFSQLESKAFQGPLNGSSLTIVDSILTKWSTWKYIHPDTIVVKRPDYKFKKYFFNPFSSYENHERIRYPAYFSYNVTNAFLKSKSTKQITFIVKIDDNHIILATDELEIVHNFSWNNKYIVVMYSESDLYFSAYIRELEDMVLDFEVVNPSPQSNEDISTPFFEYRFRDTNTGSVWNITGHCLEGPLVGSVLTKVYSHSAYWFAAVSFYPQGPYLRSGSLFLASGTECLFPCEEFIIERWPINELVSTLDDPVYITVKEFDELSDKPWSKLIVYIIMVSIFFILLVSMITHYFFTRKRHDATIPSIASMDDLEDDEMLEMAVSPPSPKKKKKVSFEIQEYEDGISMTDTEDDEEDEDEDLSKNSKEWSDTADKESSVTTEYNNNDNSEIMIDLDTTSTPSSNEKLEGISTEMSNEVDKQDADEEEEEGEEDMSSYFSQEALERIKRGMK